MNGANNADVVWLICHTVCTCMPHVWLKLLWRYVHQVVGCVVVKPCAHGLASWWGYVCMVGLGV